MYRRSVRIALLFAFGLVACGGDESAGDAEPDTTSSERTSTTEATTTTTAAPTTTTTFPTPADGSDVQACADGTCEVLVSTSTQFVFEDRFGFSSGVITAISPEGVEGSFGERPGTVTTFFGTPGGGPDISLGSPSASFSVDVIAIRDDTAVIRFTSPPAA